MSRHRKLAIATAAVGLACVGITPLAIGLAAVSLYLSVTAPD